MALGRQSLFVWVSRDKKRAEKNIPSGHLVVRREGQGCFFSTLAWGAETWFKTKIQKLKN